MRRYTIPTAVLLAAATLATAACGGPTTPTAAGDTASTTPAAPPSPSPSPSPTGTAALCQTITGSGTRDALTVDVGNPDWTNPTWDSQFAKDLDNFATAVGGGGAPAPFGQSAVDSSKLAVDEGLIAITVQNGAMPDDSTFTTAAADVRALSADLKAIDRACGS